MFGTLRYLLAMMVVASHFLPYEADAEPFGRYAVVIFFVLSGYLMTRVLHETYGFSNDGLGGF